MIPSGYNNLGREGNKRAFALFRKERRDLRPDTEATNGLGRIRRVHGNAVSTS